MKKLILSLSFLLLLFAGCTNSLNTPTERVEEFLGKYQSMDSEVLAQLDSVIASDDTMSDEQKKDYRALMEKQYQNLSYKIKNETIDGDNAIVDVEIEVYDYASSIAKSKDYYNEHPEEFDDSSAKATIDTDDDVDDTKDSTTEDSSEEDKDDNSKKDSAESKDSKYIDYKIKQLKNVTDKVKYEITFNLIKENNTWKVQDISDMDRQKIHGLFEQ